MENLDDGKRFQFSYRLRRFIAMQLHRRKRKGAQNVFDFRRGGVHEITDSGHERRNRREDVRSILGRDKSFGGGVTDDADGVSAGPGRRGGVLGSANAADFYAGS